MKIAPEPSLRLWPVTVELGGHRFRIPPYDAGRWMVAMLGHYHDIVPGLVQDDDTGTLFRMIIDQRVTTDECHKVARDAIATISGMHWWSALRLAHYLSEYWGTLGGALVMRGVNPAVAPLGAVLTATYRMLQESARDELERAKIDMELERPPDGIPIDQVYDEDKAADNFMALMSSGG